jgi:lipopolysaccharide transport system permease protein
MGVVRPVLSMGKDSDGSVHPSESDPSLKVLRLAPTRGWVSLGLRDVWHYRELLWFLAVKDIKVRYKQTALGASWAVLQPVATAAVFALVFGRLAKLPSDGVDYAVFALAGLIIWNFFSSAVAASSLSLVNNTNLISKVYFPRLCVPIASMIVYLVDLLVATLVLLVAMAWYGVGGGVRIPLAVVFVLMAFAAGLGLSLWLSAIAARYRDVRQIVPFLLQFGLFVSPVAYSSSMVDSRWHLVYGLNPMAGAIEGFRWSMLGTTTDIWGLVLTSAVSTIVILVSGAYYFRRMERGLADVI